MAYSVLQGPCDPACGTFTCLLTFRNPIRALLLASLVAELATAAVLARVETSVRTSQGLEADLRTLCDAIGPRMAGTEAMRDALQWGLQSFRDAGLQNARLEPVPIPLAWREGETRIEVVQPRPFRLRAAASAFSPSVREPVEGELALGGTGQRGAVLQARESLRGKIVLVELREASSLESLGLSQRDAMVAVREAAEVGALAVLIVSTRPQQLIYRHVNNLSAELDPIPSALVAREEGLRLARLLELGERVQVRLEMPNQIGPPFETANVVAEIPGEGLPDEIVLLGAHLDSWDMGTGCLDNAVNVALVLHVARAIAEAGVRPLRTLRFVLFGGEEFGLFGSLAYVDSHRAELDRHVATIVHDMGGGPFSGYSTGGRRDLLRQVERLLGGADEFGRFRHTAKAYFMSDNFTFMLQGVPSLFAVQETSDYYSSYHSEADTFDKVDIDSVRSSAVVAARTLVGIAHETERIAERLSAAEVSRWLQGQGLIRHLRFLGVWDEWRPQRDGAGFDSN